MPAKTCPPCLLFLALAWLTAPATAAGAGPDCAAYPPPVDVEMRPTRVSEHVYYVQGEAGMATEHKGFISNASFVVTGDGVVVLDALGTPSLAARLVETIRSVTDQPVRTVILSHYHADHVYGLQVFKDLGATIIGPQAAFDYIGSEHAERRLAERRDSLSPWVSECTRLVPPDRVVRDEMALTMGEVELQATFLGAAHSDGDIAVYVRPDRVLLSGDIIFEGRIPWVGDANTSHWLDVLKDLEQTGVEALVPGHGPAAEEPTRAVATTRRYLEYLRRTMGDAVEGFVPFSQAYAETDWSEWRDMPAFDAANRRNAYQVYLGMEAELLQ